MRRSRGLARTPYAIDNRHGNPGRPPKELGNPTDPIEHEHEGNILSHTVRVWVEGEIIVPDWDEEGHLHKDELADLLRKLKPALERASDLTDETGKRLPGVLKLMVQPLNPDTPSGTGYIPRKYARRSPLRYTLDEAYRFIMKHPGRTLPELTVEMFPEEDHEILIPRVRMMLHRLNQKDSITRRKIGVSTEWRYYTTETVNFLWRPEIERICDALVLIYGGAREDYYDAAHKLESAATGKPIITKEDSPF